MKKRQWIILGATSIIAQKFAHIAAQEKQALLLIGRKENQLQIIASDIQLRYKIPCDILVLDLSSDIDLLLHLLENGKKEFDLFIAHSEIDNNDNLTPAIIERMLKTNVLSTCQIIHSYLSRRQKKHRLIFLSSVAAHRGRMKNSLYGGSKAAIEVYLEGLQQGAKPNQFITIIRLGFIDTRQTYGQKGVFYAAKPENCAKACWKAMNAGKKFIYYPHFWRLIIAIIGGLPFFLYQRMRKI
ncbi:SDR family NAD(P)-dependent oxidoreductase [Legionella israelensis]|uniref:SDR family NAD(P)-dependent oxidoreductase n=1 Tax=Legionella israelensis TaxID=454 RepID=A0AAX1EG05_9GAMM|nr:SDR family NAD(P)-dependent oxidoreductase [Legionella israelensis]QBR84036.1 SDR family NAD(P)-dependent oxidoreductase [Legionella israelensis]